MISGAVFSSNIHPDILIGALKWWVCVGVGGNVLVCVALPWWVVLSRHGCLHNLVLSAQLGFKPLEQHVDTY